MEINMTTSPDKNGQKNPQKTTEKNFLERVRDMRGVTVAQPYTSLIAHGKKQILSLPFRTEHRGWVAIRARSQHYFEFLDQNYGVLMDTQELLAGKEEFVCGRPVLPRGAFVAVATLAHCLWYGATRVAASDAEMMGFPDTLPSSHWAKFETIPVTEQEQRLGTFTPGHYAYYLTDVTALPTPVGYRGGRSLYTLPESVSREIFAGLMDALTPEAIGETLQRLDGHIKGAGKV